MYPRTMQIHHARLKILSSRLTMLSSRLLEPWYPWYWWRIAARACERLKMRLPDRMNDLAPLRTSTAGDRVAEEYL
jgi:hypothetical protein